MEIKTNEEKVAIWRIAWELCEKIVFSVKEDWDEEGELVTIQPPEPNTEEWVSRKAELIRQTYNKLQQ